MSVTRNACRGLRALDVVQLLYARAARNEPFDSESTLALLKTLCNIGLELDSNELLGYYVRDHWILGTSGLRFTEVYSYTNHFTFIDALLVIFQLGEPGLECDANSELYFSTFLRHGLLFPQRGATTLC